MLLVGGVALSGFIAFRQEIVEKYGELIARMEFQIAAKTISWSLLVNCRHHEHYFTEIG
jgi:hypothetical protein